MLSNVHLERRTKRNRLRTYKKLLKFYENTDTEIGLCNAMMMIGKGFGLKGLPELQALRPKTYYAGTRYWWSPRNTKKRIEVLKVAIAMASPAPLKLNMILP